LGVLGLMRTMALQARTETLRIWGPRGAVKMIRKSESLGFERLTFPVEVRELAPGDAVPRKDYSIDTFEVEHRGAPTLGFAIVEAERRGRFNPDRARELGIPEGPLWGQLHRGMTVTLPDGRTVDPRDLVGEPRPGRRVVITGDTRPCATTAAISTNAQLLVH